MPGRMRRGCLTLFWLTQATFSWAATSQHEVVVDGVTRTFRVYTPPQYDPHLAWPVVLAFHGAFEDGVDMEQLSGLSRLSDEAGFIVVYPDGILGFGNRRFWNTGSWKLLVAPGCPDESRFVECLLDELPLLFSVDAHRVFATGYSIGGMLCHQLAAEFPQRIAAIAPVAGPLAIPISLDASPAPVMLFHGTGDPIIPFEGPVNFVAWFLGFSSVEDTIFAWCEINQCSQDPVVSEYPDIAEDCTTVERWDYSPDVNGSEVVLIKILGGGHLWPGEPPGTWLYGNATFDIHANELMWEFFQQHSLSSGSFATLRRSVPPRRAAAQTD